MIAAKKDFQLSEKQEEMVNRPFDVTLEILEGTPRSGKTTAMHFRLALFYITSRDTNHLVSAYNHEQAYRLFIDGDGTGLMHIFGDLCRLRHDDHGDHLEIHTPNGIKRVYYKGGAKINSVGAITGMSLGSVAYTEINLLNMKFIQETFRRTFAAQDRYHIGDMNPPAPQHPIFTEVFEVYNARLSKWLMKDNPIISEERRTELYNQMKNNPYLLARDWYGERVMPQGVIYSMFDTGKHTMQKIKGRPLEMYFTADGGQSDATSCACNVISYDTDNKKYILQRVAHYYHSGADTGEIKSMSKYAKDIKAFMEYCINYVGLQPTYTFVDPACKSLREELHDLGIQTDGADNNARDAKRKGGGIEVGIERTQNLIDSGHFYIVENDRYDHYNFVKEVGMYVRDDHGDPVDAFNHSMDELRYSVNYFYRRYILNKR